MKKSTTKKPLPKPKPAASKTEKKATEKKPTKSTKPKRVVKSDSTSEPPPNPPEVEPHCEPIPPSNKSNDTKQGEAKTGDSPNIENETSNDNNNNITANNDNIAIVASKEQTNFLTISSFYDISDYELEEYNFTNAPILSFDGISALQRPKKIWIINALFTSFKNVKPMPTLTSVSFAGSPISQKTYYRQMILYSFGSQIEEIDGIMVTPEEKRAISSLNKEMNNLITDYVINGGIILKEIDNEFVEEVKRRKMPLPVLTEDAINVERYSTLTEFTPFLTKQDVKGIFENQGELKLYEENQSTEVELEARERLLINEIETSFFLNPNNLDFLPSRTKLVQICNEIEIKKAEDDAFLLIRQTLSKLTNEIEGIRSKIPDGREINSLFYKEVSDIFLDVIKALSQISLETQNTNTRCFSSIFNHICQINNILQRYSGFSHIIENIHQNHTQILQELQNLQTMIILPTDNKDKNNIEYNDSKQYTAIKNVIKIFRSSQPYIDLLQKSISPRYLVLCYNIYDKSYKQYQLTLQLFEGNKKWQEISTAFSEFLNFISTLSQEYETITTIFHSVPKYQHIEEEVKESIGEARNNLRQFSIGAVENYKQKSLSRWAEGSESHKKRETVAHQVEIVSTFLAQSFEWQEKSGSVLYFINDLCSAGEETAMMHTKKQKNILKEKLSKLKQMNNAKNDELNELLKECEIQGIPVDV